MMFNDEMMLMDEHEMIPAMPSMRSTMSGMEATMEGCGMGTGSADRMI